jgi:hypothetical protein
MKNTLFSLACFKAPLNGAQMEQEEPLLSSASLRRRPSHSLLRRVQTE